MTIIALLITSFGYIFNNSSANNLINYTPYALNVITRSRPEQY